MLLLAVTIFLPLATAKRQPPSSPPSLLAQLIDGEFKGATKLVPMAILAGSLALLAAVVFFEDWFPVLFPGSQKGLPSRRFGSRLGDVRVSVVGFPAVGLARMSSQEQGDANEAVRHAVEDLGITYFDVAPEYGDGVAQARLGPALEPFRARVFLAAKTMFRDREGAAKDLATTLEALRTPYLDLYQLHSISSAADVEQVLAPGGAMEVLEEARDAGVVRAVGFSAHDEAQAVALCETGRFDTVMFPVNFGAMRFAGLGRRVLAAAAKHHMKVVALKACAAGRVKPEEGDRVGGGEEKGAASSSSSSSSSMPPKPQPQPKHIPPWKQKEMADFPVYTSRRHPSCWYEPEDDPAFLRRLLLWSLDQKGVSAVLPPGDLALLDAIVKPLQGRRRAPSFLEACAADPIAMPSTYIGRGGSCGNGSGSRSGGGSAGVGDTPRELMRDAVEAAMRRRYEKQVPIFHERDASGNKVTHGGPH